MLVEAVEAHPLLLVQEMGRVVVEMVGLVVLLVLTHQITLVGVAVGMGLRAVVMEDTADLVW